MRALHNVIGVITASSAGALVIWAIVARVRRREPGPVFTRAAVAVGGIFIAQIMLGIALVASGERRPALHYFYGAFALVVLGAGVGLGRSLTRERWVPVAVAAAVAAALAVRAIATGR